jgi:hypothetical protein
LWNTKDFPFQETEFIFFCFLLNLCSKSTNSAQDLFYCTVIRFSTREYIYPSLLHRFQTTCGDDTVSCPVDFWHFPWRISDKVSTVIIHVCLVPNLRILWIVLSLFPYVFRASEGNISIFLKYLENQGASLKHPVR